MVKFGKHQQFFLEHELQDSSLYTVPYNEFKHSNIPAKDGDGAMEGLSRDETKDNFLREWRVCLEKCQEDFASSTKDFWASIFEGIAELPEARGALPDHALHLYLNLLDEDQAHELHALLKAMHATALLNSEALRKLVKKYDKSCGTNLSTTLLPEIYCSNFTIGQNVLESGLVVIRRYLGLDGEDDDDEAVHETKSRLERLSIDLDDPTFDGFLPMSKKDSDAALIDKRNNELNWLRSFTKSFDPNLIGCLVGHRGFHSVKDRSDRRPIENSLTAYEAAWTNGIDLCECDIALTKDEKLILAHDEDFTRLALDKTSPLSQKKVRDLTYREIISLPLKSGVRPPLLFDVLRSADAIGGGARMIVEIKPGNVDAGIALARLFARHPDLMARVAVVMSFDCFAMHQFRKHLTHVMNQLALEHQQASEKGTSPTKKGHRPGLSSVNLALPTSMSIGANLEEFSVPAVNSSQQNLHSLARHRRIDSTDHFGVGMMLGGSGSMLHGSISRDDSQPLVNNTTRGSFVEQDDGNGFGQFEPITERGMSFSKAPEGLAPITSGVPLEEPLAPAVIPSEEMLYRPKLLLITVCETPKKECELEVDINNLKRIDNWVRGGEAGDLDGVYMQFQKEMLEPEGIAAMSTLASKYDVGIWGANNPGPDDFATFEALVNKCGVKYVNSSLPRKFMIDWNKRSNGWSSRSKGRESDLSLASSRGTTPIGDLFKKPV